MTERIRLTQKAYDHIEAVKKGKGTIEDGCLANDLDFVDKRPSLYLVMRKSGRPAKQGEICRLIEDGYLEIYEDKPLDFWEGQFENTVGCSNPEEKEYVDQEDLEIGPKGRTIMELMILGISLPKVTYELGKWLFKIEEEGEAPPWVVNRLYREDFLVKSENPPQFELVEEPG